MLQEQPSGRNLTFTNQAPSKSMQVSKYKISQSREEDIHPDCIPWQTSRNLLPFYNPSY